MVTYSLQGRAGDARDEPEGGVSVPTEKRSEIITAEQLKVKPESFQSLYLHTLTSTHVVNLEDGKQMSTACSCSGHRSSPCAPAIQVSTCALDTESACRQHRLQKAHTRCVQQQFPSNRHKMNSRRRVGIPEVPKEAELFSLLQASVSSQIPGDKTGIN